MRFGRDMRHRVSALNVTFRKISTGLRVTRAADDASGMGIAERLKSQIMETQEEIRGSTDQISMLQTLDSSLALAQERLLRMREIANRAANDSQSFVDRQALTEEFMQIMQELDELSENATFNGKKILDRDEPLMLSLDQESTPITVLTRNSLRAENLARQTSHTSLRKGVFLDPLTSGEVSINGVAIRGTTDADDKASFCYRSGSAIAKANAINHSTEFTGVEAWVEDTVIVGVEPIRALDFTTDHWLKINGWGVSGFELVEKDATGKLVQHINWGHEESGVRAEIDSAGRLILYAQDGRNITVEYSDDAVRDACRLIDVCGDAINLADAIDAPDYIHSGDIINQTTYRSSSGSTVPGISVSVDNVGGIEGDSGTHPYASDYADYYLEIIEPGKIGEATYRIKRETVGIGTSDIADNTSSGGESGFFNAAGVLDLSQGSTPGRIGDGGSYYNSASDRKYTIVVDQSGDPKSGLVGNRPTVSVFETNLDIDPTVQTPVAGLQGIVVEEDDILDVGNGVKLEIKGSLSRKIGNVTTTSTYVGGSSVQAQPTNVPTDHDYPYDPRILYWSGTESTDFEFEIKPGGAGHSLGSSAGGGRAQITVTASNSTVTSKTFDFNPDASGTHNYQDITWSDQGLTFRVFSGRVHNPSRGTVQSENFSNYNGSISTRGDFAHDEDRKYVMTVRNNAVFNDDSPTASFNIQTFEDTDNDGQVDDLVRTDNNVTVPGNSWFELGTVSHQGDVFFGYTPVTLSQSGGEVTFSNDSYTTPEIKSSFMRVIQGGALGAAKYDYYSGGVKLASNQTLSATGLLPDGIRYNATAPNVEVNLTSNPSNRLQLTSSAYNASQEGDFTIEVEEVFDFSDPLNPTSTHFYKYKWDYADGSSSGFSAQSEITVGQNISLDNGISVRFTGMPADGSTYTGNAKPPHFEVNDQWNLTVNPRPLNAGEQVTLFYEATDFAEGATWDLETVNYSYWTENESMIVDATNNYDTAELALTDTITHDGMGLVRLSGGGEFQTGDQVRIETRGYIGEVESRGEYTKGHYPTDYIFTVTEGGSIDQAKIAWQRKDKFVDGVDVPDLEFGGQGTLSSIDADRWIYIEHGLEININDVLNGSGNSIAYLAQGDQFTVAVGKKLKYTFAGQLTLKSRDNIDVDYEIDLNNVDVDYAVTDISDLTPDDLTEAYSDIDNKLGRINFTGTFEQANQAGDKDLTLTDALHGKNMNHALSTTHLLNRGAIRDALHTIDLSLQQLGEDRTTIGSVMNRIEHKAMALSQKSIDLLGIHTRLTGADMAQEAARFAAEQLQMTMTPFLLEKSKVRSLVALDLVEKRQGGRFL